jgi:hypothetical protein
MRHLQRTAAGGSELPRRMGFVRGDVSDFLCLDDIIYGCVEYDTCDTVDTVSTVGTEYVAVVFSGVYSLYILYIQHIYNLRPSRGNIHLGLTSHPSESV